jgi:transposase-like protein
VDKPGQTIDFLLTEQRDERAATPSLTKAIRRLGVPEKITIDGSEVNAAAIRGYNTEHGTVIVFRQEPFKSAGQAQRFLAAYGTIAQHFRPRRHRLSAPAYRQEMRQRFRSWRKITGLAMAA